MSVERNVYKNGKYICTLWPSHNFNNLLDDEEIALFKLHLVSKMRWSDDGETRYMEVEEWNYAFNDFIQDVISLGGGVR